MEKAVIFDLDGTLLDTKEDVASAMNRVLAEMELPSHTPEAYARFLGRGARALVFDALPAHRRDEATVDTALAAFQADYGRHWKVQSIAYPGIPALLDALAARQVQMAVLSNKPHAITVKVVAALLPGWSFATVLGQRDGVPRKPDPAGALEVARVFDRDPADILFVGDTQFDMETALRAGMVPIAVSWGFRPVAELADSGAQAVLESPRELLDYLG